LTKQTEVSLWTDGSAYPQNPGNGGWGAVLIHELGEKRIILELSGEVPMPPTTQNQAETVAVIEALKYLKKPCKVQVYTDSRYVILGMEKVIKRAASKPGKMPKANLHLWESLLKLLQDKGHLLVPNQVAGHAGVKYNELADRLAYLAAAEGRTVEDRSEQPITKTT